MTRGKAHPLALSVALTGIVLAWLISTPAGGAPDELDHYNRALSAGRGQLLGAPVNELTGRFLNFAEATSYLRTTRRVDLPPRLAPPPAWSCLMADHTSSAACTARDPGPGLASQLTAQGTRLPYLYAPAGVVVDAVAGDPTSALLVGRLLFALVSIALLLAAVGLCWDGHATSLVGLTVALSPGVLWAAAMLNPSGPEIAAGVLMAAAAVRLGRDPATLGRGWWLAVSVGALVLGSSRPPGPGWVALYLLLFVLEARPAGIRLAVRRAPGWAVLGVVCVVAGVAANLAWQSQVPPQGLSPAVPALLKSAGAALASIPETIGEEIGVFGADDILMPRWVYGLWGLAFIGVVAVALLRGRRRDLRLVELALVLSFGIRAAFDLVFTVTAGSPAQGRHLLPMTVVVAVLAGEAIHRNREYIGSARPLLATAAVVFPAVQLIGLLSAAHRYAVGRDGAWWFLPASQWSPPGGWLPSLSLGAAGALVMVFSLRPGRSLPREAPQTASQ